MLAPQRWQAGDLIYDRRYLAMSQAPNAEWEILVGLYDRASPAKRAPAMTSDGERYPDDAVPISEATTR
jgi:hypothetical protein